MHNTQVFSVSVDNKLAEGVRREAARQDRSVSSVASEALNDYMAKIRNGSRASRSGMNLRKGARI